MIMSFSTPLALLLLLAIPLALWFARGKGGRLRYSSIRGIKDLTKNRKYHPRLLLPLLRALALGLMIIALARPQAGKSFRERNSEGVDIMIAIDTSGSMQALDFKIEGKAVDRLTVVKKVVSEFIEKRASDRMGLVVFGEDAFIQCPITWNHGLLQSFLKEAAIGMAGDATAIGSAIGVSVNRMKDLKAKSKVLILLTDGRSNAGRISPQTAAELAKTFGIKIYTIGIGTDGKAPFLVEDIFGPRYVYQEVDIDEETLQAIAQATDGHYFRATDTDKLAEIYQEIDKLETTEVTLKEYTEYEELYHWFLLPGLMVLLLEIALAHTLLRKIP
jgi:Ca-activated chloride channel family protein